MGKLKIILHILIISGFSFANEWSPIGPDTVKVNDYMSSFWGDILCVDDGLLIFKWEENEWITYSNAMMPAIQAVEYDTSGIMVLLSDSSWSDGIYKFSFKEKQFSVLKYTAFPRFLFRHHLSNSYYCGYGYGVLKSEDGTNWEEVEYFKGKECRAIGALGDVLLVADEYTIHYSYDMGKSWNASTLSPSNVSAITWDSNGTAFSIFPGTSRSSGLWSSQDSGKTWQVEFWSTHMSTARFTYGELFVGWEQPDGENEGVAIWNEPKTQLTFLNEGLPKSPVNRFSENTLIDCYNVVVCTDSGAYITCGFPVSIHEFDQVPGKFTLGQNYPNPFNPGTTISYQLGLTAKIDLSIYNILGQKIVTLVSGIHQPGEYKMEWDASNFPGGVYYYKLSTERGFSKSKKMVLIK